MKKRRGLSDKDRYRLILLAVFVVLSVVSVSPPVPFLVVAVGFLQEYFVGYWDSAMMMLISLV